MNKKTIIILLLLIFCKVSNGQVVETLPYFATENDTVTVIFNAALGNKALINLGPPDVYAHTGVITSKSSSGSDWKYVQGVWGTNDAPRKMTYLGNNKYKIRYPIRSFYGVPTGETVYKLAFVFRDLSGNKVGRSTDGTDIFVPLFSSGLKLDFKQPANYTIFKQNDSMLLEVVASEKTKLELFKDGVFFDSVTSDIYSKKIGLINSGTFQYVAKITKGTEIKMDTLNITVYPGINYVALPNNIEDGINYLNDSTVVLSLYAPRKNFVCVVGDFNNWSPVAQYFMNLSPDSTRWWLEVKNLKPNKQYTFQYLVDGTLKIADPYSSLVLDPWNDQYISNTVYPNLLAYPQGKTTGIASVMHPGKPVFGWTKNIFNRPENAKLNIYELHIRDFIAAHTFNTLKDTLNYLKRLGINAVQLMPVSEFEGNSSWGYNVSFHGALDKYYGTDVDFKNLVEACHANGMAVILDVVFNHAFGQNPLCQLYWNSTNNTVANDNPWLNPTAKHDYNVGYDFNHESKQTQYYIDKILKYWVTEFHIDGFRFDLSKGFTQKNTLGNVAAWGNYDASRINLWKRIKSKIEAYDTKQILILEHFADNSEETELANNGFLLWGNMNYSYNEMTKGNGADISYSSYKTRGWSKPNMVLYMESHDEERLMYNNLNSGNTSGTYSVKNLPTALERVQQASVLFFGVPGPKMIWQFGELGYDVSINNNGRTGEKPIRWNYLTETNRKKLNFVCSEMMKLRNNYGVFHTTDFKIDLGGTNKTIRLNDTSMNVHILANTNIKDGNVTGNFQNTGKWYEYFSGDSINLSTTAPVFYFKAGEYRLYTTKRIFAPKQTNAIKPKNTLAGVHIFPNPSNGKLTLQLTEPIGEGDLQIIDAQGRVVLQQKLETQQSNVDFEIKGAAGMYLVRIVSNNGTYTEQILKR